MWCLERERLRALKNSPLFRLAVLGTLGLYWTAMFVGTHLPQGGGAGVQVNDKLLHFTAYAGLAFLLAAALTCFRIHWTSFLFVLAIAFAYGGVDEVSQLIVAGRESDLEDWAADVIGACAGVSLFALFLATLNRVLRSSPAAAAAEA